ncbi:aldo/keto reductase [Leifsonia sp. 2MCAF36]|uniref:aldo/keto reductase n=1 Tax=Leifsonia sp. 2MCAF36 TaxID=3232988 RepID=UPI003F9D1B40
MSDTTTLRPGGEAHLAGRPIARIGYGTMQLGELPVHAGVAPDAAVALLRQAVELGVNHFDTAQFYGAGFANEMLRRALAPFGDDIVVVSKVGAKTGPEGTPLVSAQKPHELREEVEANLAGLGVDRLGAVNLRRTGSGVGLEAIGDQVVDLDDQLAEMIALRDEGKIGGIGLSTVTLEQLQQALPAGIVTVQNSYSLLARSDEPLLELAEREGITWAPYFPLGSAFPGFPKVTQAPEVLDAARALGATPAQIGLAWLLQHSPQMLLIPGTGSLTHLRENVDTGRVTLDAETVATLDSLAGD